MAIFKDLYTQIFFSLEISHFIISKELLIGTKNHPNEFYEENNKIKSHKSRLKITKIRQNNSMEERN